MQIIDFHTHTFPGRIAEKAITKLSGNSHTHPFSDGTAEGLIENMHRAGIERSVILPVATSAAQVEKVNDSSARLNELYGESGLYSFGCIHPDYEGYREELGRFAGLGLSGVKLHPVFCDVALDDIRYLRIIDRAAELGITVITHSGYDVGYPGVDLCSPKMARQVIDEIGDFNFVLAHMGGWHMWDIVPEYLADTKCFLDTSFSTGRMTPLAEDKVPYFDSTLLDEEWFLEIVNKFGSERIVFGTDSPWSEPENEIKFINSLPLNDAEKENIFYNNALKLLSH